MKSIRTISAAIFFLIAIIHVNAAQSASINTGSYAGFWSISGQTGFLTGNHVIPLDQGTFFLSIGVQSSFPFTVDAGGNVSTPNPAHASGVGDTLTFNTTTINVETEPLVPWSIGNVTPTIIGPAPVVVVPGPGPAYLFAFSATEQRAFRVAEPCAVDPTQFVLGGFTFDITCGVIQVTIDIKPGSDPNSINICAGGGVVPAAVFSTAEFDATTIDPDTARLADVEIRTVGKSGRLLAHEEDVDGDGYVDLVMQFPTVDLALEFEVTDTEALFKAKIFDIEGGEDVEGSDAVRFVKTC